MGPSNHFQTSMPTQPDARMPAGASLLGKYPRYAGVAVASLGLLVMACWFEHWRPILQMLPGSAPMQFNTALCFVFSGAGLFLLTTRNIHRAQWLAGPAVLFTFLTLLEYPAHWDLGIDQGFLKPYFEADTFYPGRMSPLAAVCFILVGTGTILASARGKWAHRITAAGILACIVMVIALVALLGFVLRLSPAYSWGSYSGMALNTAVALSTLGSGLLVRCWQMVRHEDFNLLRWLPVSGSLTLMAMIIFVSAVSATALGEATFWRRKTIETLLGAQAFEVNFADLQRGLRYYAILGDPNGLVSYKRCLALEPRLFRRLVELTSDNPAQQRRLRDLGAAMEAAMAYDRRMIALRDREGSEAASKSDNNGERRKVLDDARGILTTFSLEEQRLLDARDALEQADASDATRLLIYGSVLAAAMVLIANYAVGREMKRRRSAEIEGERLIGELRRLLEEVKTLSGMIPICGWCKCIRTDKGYWQCVEQYVGEHTDATFTHGICPDCAVKLEAELVASHSI